MKKIAVITGGASGIGKCLVKTLAEHGMAVVFIDNDKPRLEKTEAEMKAQGFDVTAFSGDIADEAVLNTYQPQYSPGDIAQHPSGRIGEPEDIASAVLFLADERNTFINGENLVIDGGMTKQMIYHNDHGWKLG